MRRLTLGVPAARDDAAGATRYQAALAEGVLASGWLAISVSSPWPLDACQVSWRYADERGFGPPFELGRMDGALFAVVRVPRPIAEIRLFPLSVSEPLAESLQLTLRRAPVSEIGLRLAARGLRVARTNPLRALRAIPRAWAILAAKGSSALPRLGISGRENWRADYAEWLARESDRAAVVDPALAETGPAITVVMPVYRPPLALLEEAIASVRAQSYTRWTLVLVDDASGDPKLDAMLRQAALDPRITLARRAVNGGISAATNDAIALATGDFVAFLDQDDLLAQDALLHVAQAILRRPSASLVYSDEDKIDALGVRSEPFFKPDWDPDLILGQNYLNHLTVMRRTSVLHAGGLDPAFDGAQDHDLILRVTDNVACEDVVHVPRVLYHWRAIAGSTALSISEKPQVLNAAQRAVSAALDRRRVKAEVTAVENAPYQRVIYPVPSPAPLVSIIIPTRDRHDLLEQCLMSLDARTDYARREVVLVDNGTVQPEALALMRTWRDTGRATIVRDEGDFNFSRLINRGAGAARGDVLVLLNNDIEIIQRGWLTELTAQASRPGVGCVGAKLLYPNDTVQHAGVVLGMGGIAGHWQAGAEMHDLGYGARLVLTWRPSAVTAACLATPRAVFEAVQGFDERLTISFNDVDYCLRVRKAGHAVVWTPAAVLKHHESASRGRADDLTLHAPIETELMQDRWGSLIARDPAFNPNLSLTSQTTRLRL